MKAVGTGFTKSPRSFSIYMENETYRVSDEGESKDYDFYLYSIPKGYRLAVCEGRAEKPGKEMDLDDEELGARAKIPIPQEIILPEQF